MFQSFSFLVSRLLVPYKNTGETMDFASEGITGVCTYVHTYFRESFNRSVQFPLYYFAQIVYLCYAVDTKA